jgi:hypothetical protein
MGQFAPCFSLGPSQYIIVPMLRFPRDVLSSDLEINISRAFMVPVLRAGSFHLDLITQMTLVKNTNYGAFSLFHFHSLFVYCL